MVSSNTQASPIFHARVSPPTRNRAGPGRISGRWQSRRTLVEPVCAGMRVLASRAENMAVGANSGCSAIGRPASSAAVFGQSRQAPSCRAPSFHRRTNSSAANG